MADLWVKKKSGWPPAGESRHAGSIGFTGRAVWNRAAKALYTRSPGENKGPLPVEREKPALILFNKIRMFFEENGSCHRRRAHGEKSPQGLDLQRKRRGKKKFFRARKKIFCHRAPEKPSGRACRACPQVPCCCRWRGGHRAKRRGRARDPFPISFIMGFSLLSAWQARNKNHPLCGWKQYVIHTKTPFRYDEVVQAHRNINGKVFFVIGNQGS